MGTHPFGAGSGSPASLPGFLHIFGFWPFYKTSYQKIGETAEWCEHFGKKELTAYIVQKRLEGAIEIYDDRKYWK